MIFDELDKDTMEMTYRNFKLLYRTTFPNWHIFLLLYKATWWRINERHFRRNRFNIKNTQ